MAERAEEASERSHREKVAVLLHHLWVSGGVYEPPHHSTNRRTTAAKQHCRRLLKSILRRGKTKPKAEFR